MRRRRINGEKGMVLSMTLDQRKPTNQQGNLPLEIANSRYLQFTWLTHLENSIQETRGSSNSQRSNWRTFPAYQGDFENKIIFFAKSYVTYCTKSLSQPWKKGMLGQYQIRLRLMQKIVWRRPSTTAPVEDHIQKVKWGWQPNDENYLKEYK